MRRVCAFRPSSVLPRAAVRPSSTAAAPSASAAAAAAAPSSPLADISPQTAFEAARASEALVERRVERFVSDMYRVRTLSPLVVVLSAIGVGGFAVTWLYNVATPVWLAHAGRSVGGDDSDGNDLGGE